jgi:TonB family protein
MFEDFATSTSQQHNRARLRRSLGVAFAIYLTAGTAIVSATNKARELVKEHLTQVEFAPPEVKPKPEPPPPVEAPKPKSARAGVSKRAALKPPDEIPTEKPAESDEPLSDPGQSGAQDGVLGELGGTGKDSLSSAPPPPPAPPPKLVLPKELPGNQQPSYPKAAQREEIEGDVLVSFDVLEDGSVTNPKIVKGPSEFHEVVLRIALTWRYRPATLGGKPVRQRHTKLVTFRLED